MSQALIIIAVGATVASSCALIGSFLMLRRMTLLGDAISHAVLPGIVIAFMLTGERSPLPMLLGAGALGVVTVFLVELFNRTQRLEEDASIGVVFPALFSIGVILVSRYTAQVDLDLDCVIYGEIAYAPLDTLTWNGVVIGPKALWVNGTILVGNLIFVGLLFKELKLSTFDAPLAATLGFSPVLLHYLLMSSVSVTVVGAFESVGAILVLAMLVAPAATAYLLTDRLERLMLLAVAFGIASAIGGYFLAAWLDASIAGCTAVVTGLFFLAALLFAPHHGLLGRRLRRMRLGRRFAEQLMLLHLGDVETIPVDALRRRFAWSPRQFSGTLDRLIAARQAERVDGGLRLTSAGLAALEKSGQLELQHRD